MNFKNHFVNQYIQSNNLKIISFDEERPWGGFYIYEVGKNFDKKILCVKPKQYLSLQFHGSKESVGHSERWQALTKAKVVLGNKSAVELNSTELQTELNNLKIITLNLFEVLDIPSGFLHALVNPYSEDIFILETRTSMISEETSQQRESNITRIYDQSRRDGLPEWPEALIKRINE